MHTAENDYAQGGQRDVRVRAVEGIHRVEGVVLILEGMLKRTRAVGRTLRLHYHRRDDRYVWRHRVRDHEGEQRRIRSGEEPKVLYRWQDIGRRVPDDICHALWGNTRARVLGIERQLDMRHEGRTVLTLVSWLLGNTLSADGDLIHLAWEGDGQRGHVAWTFRLDGRLQKTTNWEAAQGPVSKYGRDAEEQVAAVEPAAPRSHYTENVHNQLVLACADIDARLRALEVLLRGQRSLIRFYYHKNLDRWQIRLVQWQSSTRYLANEELEAEMEKRQLTAQQRGQVEEARTLMQKRQRIRRCLRVIAEVAETALRWPGGTWRVRGCMVGGKTIWAVAAAAGGTVGKVYDVQKTAESV